MPEKHDDFHLDARPQSDVFATYQRMAYKGWSAIGEFVDNSTQNFIDHRSEIEKAFGTSPKLTIEIVYEPTTHTLTVWDDANGMSIEELTRAVQLNKPPANRAGR